MWYLGGLHKWRQLPFDYAVGGVTTIESNKKLNIRATLSLLFAIIDIRLWNVDTKWSEY